VLFVTLPGVPAEMHRMFKDTLEPLIKKRSGATIVSLMLRFAGISEEELGAKSSKTCSMPRIPRSPPWSVRAKSVGARSTYVSLQGPPRARKPTRRWNPSPKRFFAACASTT
jgi:molybdopterin-biosynthesis enzyme MoeA-like protein